MGIQIAPVPGEDLDDFGYEFPPTVDAKLIRELATGRFVATGDNALLSKLLIRFAPRSRW